MVDGPESLVGLEVAGMRFWLAFLFAVVLACNAFAYLDQSFSIYARVSEDGNAKVTEKTVFFLENDAERDAFDYYLRLGNTTLFDWQRFSKSIKYHFAGGVSGLRIVAAREFSVHPNAASVTLEYDSEGVMNTTQVSSRVTSYKLNPELIAFIFSKGEISLGNGMSFTLELPPDSQEIKVSPDPGPGRRGSVITWEGPIFGKWDVEFVREKSLSQEVNEFFAKSVEDLRRNYLWVLFLLFVVVVAFKFLNPKE